jgi:hypothetical protein
MEKYLLGKGVDIKDRTEIDDIVVKDGKVMELKQRREKYFLQILSSCTWEGKYQMLQDICKNMILKRI